MCNVGNPLVHYNVDEYVSVLCRVLEQASVVPYQFWGLYLVLNP